MKCVVLFALSQLYFSQLSVAQIHLGMKAGYNLASLPFSDDEFHTHKNLSAFNAGLMASIPLSTHLLLQPEIVYSIQGINATVHATTTGDQNIKNTYNYLNLPFLIKYQLNSGLFAETGLQLGILLTANADDGKEFYVNETPYMQPVDFSWAIGLGYEIPKINLGLDIRYNLGLTNINRFAGDSFENNRVFQLGLFYFFKKL